MQRASSRPGKPARRLCGRRGAGRGGVSLWPWSEAVREAGAEPRWQGTMVEAWYMDDSREDPRKPHRPEPDRPVSLEQLSRLGVFYWKVGRGGGRREAGRVRDLQKVPAVWLRLQRACAKPGWGSPRQTRLTCALWRGGLLRLCLGEPSPESPLSH